MFLLQAQNVFWVGVLSAKVIIHGLHRFLGSGEPCTNTWYKGLYGGYIGRKWKLTIQGLGFMVIYVG